MPAGYQREDVRHEEHHEKSTGPTGGLGELCPLPRSGRHRSCSGMLTLRAPAAAAAAGYFHAFLLVVKLYSCRPAGRCTACMQLRGLQASHRSACVQLPRRGNACAHP